MDLLIQSITVFLNKLRNSNVDINTYEKRTVEVSSSINHSKQVLLSVFHADNNPTLFYGYYDNNYIDFLNDSLYLFDTKQNQLPKYSGNLKNVLYILVDAFFISEIDQCNQYDLLQFCDETKKKIEKIYTNRNC